MVRFLEKLERQKRNAVRKMTKGIHHVGPAVANLEARAIEVYTSMGFDVKQKMEVKQEKINVAILTLKEAKVELMEPRGRVLSWVSLKKEEKVYII